MIVIFLLGLYGLCGLVVSIKLIQKELVEIDPATSQTSWLFKLLIMPGMILLWPLFQLKRRAAKELLR